MSGLITFFSEFPQRDINSLILNDLPIKNMTTTTKKQKKNPPSLRIGDKFLPLNYNHEVNVDCTM